MCVGLEMNENKKGGEGETGFRRKRKEREKEGKKVGGGTGKVG